MRIEGFKEKSSEKLKSELKAIQIVMGAMAIVLFFLYTLTIYGLVVKEDKSTFIALLVVAFACSAILPFQFVMLSKIKKELKLRGSTI